MVNNSLLIGRNFMYAIYRFIRLKSVMGLCFLCLAYMLLNRQSTSGTKQLMNTVFPYTALYCNMNESAQQGSVYSAFMKNTTWWSGCYSEEYLINFFLTRPFVHEINDIVLIDVGANKGYMLASWLSLWAPDRNITPYSLGIFLRHGLNVSASQYCGSCNHCKETVLIDRSRIDGLRQPNLMIYAFEPEPNNFHILKQVQAWMNLSFLNVYNLALSNHSGQSQFRVCETGAELCSLASSSTAKQMDQHTQVNVTTIDNFLQQMNIMRSIDILKIDTEGFDALVIDGAKAALERQQIRLLIFEHHGIGMWTSIDLQSVITKLDALGYSCFMLGKTGLARLTGCWSEEFTLKVFSNVLCVLRHEERFLASLHKLLIINL